ncbi:MAG: hypothetical protein ACR5KV_01085 [Wolbachia sp.]
MHLAAHLGHVEIANILMKRELMLMHQMKMGVPYYIILLVPTIAA